MHLPSLLELVVLTVAAFRVFQLIAHDTILDRPRRWVVRLGDWKPGDDTPEGYREGLAIFLECPWCAGFWVSGLVLGAYCAVVDWIGVFSFFVVWFAMSGAVALIATNLAKPEPGPADEDDSTSSH